VVGEGVAGFKLRLRAWQKQHPEAEIENAYFVFEAVNLFAKEDADQLIAQLEERRLKEPLIVFDTLARCAVGADENSAKDMGIVIANVDRLRAELGATVILVHHTRKEDLEARGSSALAGAMDTMIAAVRQDRQRALVSLKCKKQKDAAEFDMIRLVADPVPLDDGESSLVLTGEGDGVGGEDEKDDPTPEKEKVYRDVIEGQVAMLEEPVGAEELRRLTGIPSSSFYLVLPKLVADGHIVTEGKRRKRYTARPEVREAMAQLRSRTAGEATSDGALIH